jgi:AcrR family transcriptional regulator
LVDNLRPECTRSVRAPGRPRSFDPDDALDAAVRHFWACGFDRSDMAGIANSIGVTKPCLYQLFGDKEQLFLRALEHYGATIGAAPVAAFLAAETIQGGVSAFFEVAIKGQTEPGRPSGCLMACVALARAEDSAKVKALYAKALSMTAATLKERFDEKIATAMLPPGYPSAKSAALMVDLMQALALRARAGASRDELLALGHDYTALVCNLGFQPIHD